MAEYRNLATTADGGVAVNGKPLDLTPYECKALRLLVEDAAAGKQLTTLTHLDVIAPPRADGIQKGNADLVPALNQTLGPAL